MNESINKGVNRVFLERLPNFKKLYEIVCLLLMKPIFTHLLISYLFCSFLVVLMHYVGQIPIIIKEVYITESRLQCLANYFLFQQLNVWFGLPINKTICEPRISILFLTLTWFEHLVQMFAVNCVLLPECCQSHLSSMIYHSLAQYLSENKY